jgi:hypothetical protein
MVNNLIIVVTILTLLASYGICDDNKTNNARSFVSNKPNPFSDALIIDHTSVAEFERIPTEYLDKAKELTLYYIKMSHGNQIISGIEALGKADPTYRVAIQFTSVPGLPSNGPQSALRIYLETLGPDSYWSTQAGMDRTRNAAKMNIFNVFMYSWCGEMSSYDTGRVQQYLISLEQLESEFKNVRFIYMTGHVDGGSSTLRRNNQMIRDYAKENRKVLFDFADIESYDPDGHYYSSTGRYDGECSWCPKWCAAHPSDCADIPSKCGHSDGNGGVPGGSHSMAYVCKLKAKAFWVMMARLAGWDGK